MTREDAKVFMRKEWRECMKGSFAESAFEMAIDALEQPERKKGKWINIRHDNVAECDQCGITGRAWMNFCFDCGADMREDGGENG